jgi:hypothetical protein
VPELVAQEVDCLLVVVEEVNPFGHCKHFAQTRFNLSAIKLPQKDLLRGMHPAAVFPLLKQ